MTDFENESNYEEEKQSETKSKVSNDERTLFVKNYPNNWRRKELTDFFKPYGEIDKVHAGPNNDGNNTAIV